MIQMAFLVLFGFFCCFFCFCFSTALVTQPRKEYKNTPNINFLLSSFLLSYREWVLSFYISMSEWPSYEQCKTFQILETKVLRTFENRIIVSSDISQAKYIHVYFTVYIVNQITAEHT